jgi:hypothetical protein
MFSMSIVQQAEIVVILAIVLLAVYIFYRLNLFKKE